MSKKNKSRCIITNIKVHLYANCWNELRMLPFFIRHYEPFVDKFIILDDGSTDGSVDYLKAHPKVKLLSSKRHSLSYIEQSHSFFNEAWKMSRPEADWIITCNIDEHVYHKNIELYLKQCLQKGITLLPADGFEMVALAFPSGHGRLCDEVRLGVATQRLQGPSSMLNKIMAFNPKSIENINFEIGRHRAHPTGNVVYPNTVELKLLHYKYLGMKYAEQRYAELKTGLSVADITNGLGLQYTWDRRRIRRNYEIVVCLSKVVIPTRLVVDARLVLSILPKKIRLFLLGIIFRQQVKEVARHLWHLMKRTRKDLSDAWITK